jgi:nucleotidyltransferase substrate binding protein (TIGR01987 family)
MNEVDVRWKQRFENYQRALQNLTRGVALAQTRALSELEQQGLIQSFEFTHELAWNVLKDYLEEEGFQDIAGSKTATRLAFKQGLIFDGDTWMDMIKARNLSSYTYNLEIAEKIVNDVQQRFHPAFLAMAARFQKSSHSVETL